MKIWAYPNFRQRPMSDIAY